MAGLHSCPLQGAAVGVVEAAVPAGFPALAEGRRAVELPGTLVDHPPEEPGAAFLEQAVRATARQVPIHRIRGIQDLAQGRPDRTIARAAIRHRNPMEVVVELCPAGTVRTVSLPRAEVQHRQRRAPDLLILRRPEATLPRTKDLIPIQLLHHRAGGRRRLRQIRMGPVVLRLLPKRTFSQWQMMKTMKHRSMSRFRQTEADLT